jgi:DNA-binding transcriptional MerR regulator
VARKVRLTPQKLQYLIDKGKLPGPSLCVPGRRLFTEEDVQRILQALQADPALSGCRLPEATDKEMSGVP